MGGGRPLSPLAAMKAQADRLMAQNRVADARGLYARACAVAPTDADSRVKLALAERALGRFDAAQAEARRAIKLQPRSFLGHYALGLALHSKGDVKGALRSYGTAAELEPRFPDLHYLLGVALHETGRVAEAEEAFRRALAGRPNYVEAMVGLAGVLMVRDERAGAEDLLRAALQLNPRSPEALANLAALRVKAGALDEGLQLYGQAADLSPDRLDIQVQIADLLERQGRWDEAKTLLASRPGAAQEPAAALVQARIARWEGRLEDGLAALEPACAAADRFLAGEAEILAGQLLDSLKEPDRAFERLTVGNRLVAEAMDVDLAAPPAYLDEIARARALLSAGLAASGAAPAPGGPPAPVFLIGFPRSGTTLLEKVLDSHPRIQALDERPAVSAMREAFLDMFADRDPDLESLTPAQIAELRAVYFAAVDQEVERRPEAVLVDKLPLNTVWVHLIWRVFPDARFILALRHPLDVCLACFMQHFALNTAMSSFLSLDHTATTYAAVMGLWRDLAAALPLKTHTVRYEDVVADLPREAAALLAFLDLPWDAAVLDPAQTARAGPIINTPSYHQVSRPIYADAAFRWKRYERHLAGIAPTVQPFVELFGYG